MHVEHSAPAEPTPPHTLMQTSARPTVNKHDCMANNPNIIKAKQQK